MTIAAALGQRPAAWVDGALAKPSDRAPIWLVAGATGHLGSDWLRACERNRGHSEQAHPLVQVLTTQAFSASVGRAQMRLAPQGECAQWAPQPGSVDVLIVLFDPPRLYYQRERALWAPTPSDTPALARWAAACGAHTLLLVQPHEQGRMPAALRAGLASLDEHALASSGVQRLIVLRSARAPQHARGHTWLDRMAAQWWSVFGLMLPQQWQAPRSAGVAAFALACLRHAPAGVHVATPEQVWLAAQSAPAGRGHAASKAPPGWLDGHAEQHARAWLLSQKG